MTELMLTDFGTALGRTGERFHVRRRQQPNAEFAAEDVEHILVAGKGMSLSADAIAFAVERGVPVTLLSFSGEPYARIAGGTELNDAALRREQLFATRDARGTAIVRALLNGKLRNQAATLRYFTKSRRDSAPEVYTQLQDTADGLVNHAAALEAFQGMDLDDCRTDLWSLKPRPPGSTGRRLPCSCRRNSSFPDGYAKGPSTRLTLRSITATVFSIPISGPPPPAPALTLTPDFCTPCTKASLPSSLI